jgi:hypothetical protein
MCVYKGEKKLFWEKCEGDNERNGEEFERKRKRRKWMIKGEPRLKG